MQCSSATRAAKRSLRRSCSTECSNLENGSRGTTRRRGARTSARVAASMTWRRSSGRLASFCRSETPAHAPHQKRTLRKVRPSPCSAWAERVRGLLTGNEEGLPFVRRPRVRHVRRQGLLPHWSLRNGERDAAPDTIELPGLRLPVMRPPWWRRVYRWLHGYRMVGCFYCKEPRVLVRGDFFVHLDPVCDEWAKHRGPRSH